jgi:PIN domain nuclease of toxin-antitoxin system
LTLRLLLDTHIALWAVTDSPRLPHRARDAIMAADEVHVSTVSLWEVAIKHALARQQMPVGAAEARQAFADAGYSVLAITPDHVVAVEALPPWHRDPFDRLLVAQAISEPLRLVTADAALPRYSDVVLLV